MTTREIFLETCRFGNPARTYRWEVCGAWTSALDRWRSEGMPADAEFPRYFGMDWHVGFLNFQGETGIVSGFTNSPYVPAFPTEVIAEDETTRTVRHGDGTVRRDLKVRAETSMFGEFMLPYYKQIVSRIRSKGVDPVLVDCDGNFEALIPQFIEAGINGFFPFERAAGMEPARLRRQYGHAFCMFGGIDKREVARGRAAICRHVDAFVPALLEDGGYIPRLDHTAPPDISLDAMRFMIERVRHWSEKVYGK